MKKIFIVISCVLLFLGVDSTVFAATYQYQYEKNKLVKVLKDYQLILEYIYDDNGNLTEKKKYDFMEQPVLTQPTNITSSSVSLSWDMIPKAISYKVYLNNVLYATVSTNSISIDELNSNTNYTLRVTACNLVNESSKSIPKIVLTAPSSPMELTSSNITTTSVKLSWSPTIGATSYSVYQGSPNTTIKNYIGTTSLTNFTVSGLTSNTQYVFYLKAFNGNYSNYSSGLNVITSASTVTDTYEPNDSITQAYRINTGISYYSYIFNTTDTDIYKIQNGISDMNTISIQLTVPNGNDYDLYLLNSSGSVIKSSTNGMGMNESISNPYSSGATYYVKIRSYGSFSTSATYRLSYTLSKTGTCLSCTDPIEPPNPPVEYSIAPVYTKELSFVSSPQPEITPKEELVLEQLISEELVKRLEAYELLSKIGLYGDISWLKDRKKETNNTNELKKIDLVIAKIGLKYSNQKINKSIGYILPLLNYSDNQLDTWVRDRLIELTNNPKKVDTFLKKYKDWLKSNQIKSP